VFVIPAPLACVTSLFMVVSVRSPTLRYVAAVIPVCFRIAWVPSVFPLFHTAAGVATSLIFQIQFATCLSLWYVFLAT